MRKLALALVVATGCAGMMGSKNETKSETVTAQQEAHADYQKAADAQKRATEEQSKAEAADREVATAQKNLADAQAKARGQQARAVQAQADAQRVSAMAQQQGSEAQQQAVQSQSSQKEEHLQKVAQAKKWTVEQTVNGQVVDAQGSSLRIRTRDSQNLTLGLTDSTSINIDGRMGSAANVQPGSNVRASYQMVDGKAQALSLDVRSNSNQNDNVQQTTPSPK
jgi:colicin import membrane protein